MAGMSSRKVSTPPSTSIPEASPELLPGEVLVGHAPNTQLILYDISSPVDIPDTITGTLFITNYQLCFRPIPFLVEKLSLLNKSIVKSSEHIPLTYIIQAQTISSGKKRELKSKATMPKKISELEITCKDMRRLVFNFKNCEKSDTIHVVNCLGMYSSPSSIYHLFSFDYARVLRNKKENVITADPIPTFLNPRDWQKELDRLGINQKQWRVTEANNRFLLCESLPPYIVVPYNISDDTLEYAASLHKDNRLPVWCWSHPHSGISLTRASLPDEDRLEAPDPSYMYAVSMARNLDVQVENKQVVQFKIPEWCSFSVRDIHIAYIRLHSLCISANPFDLMKQDQHWLPGLDGSRWLYYVRSCLHLASEIVNTMFNKRTSCLLLDVTDRDLSCVVSSLVQLMCDSHYRTITGLESLVQKEWVAMGHPFTSRSGLVTEGSTEDDEGKAPVFLLFCDCIWQISHQYPSAFQFSEEFLLNFYSLVTDCIYGNFIFDCAKARLQASIHSKRSSYFGGQDDQYGISDAEQYDGPLVSAWGSWRNSLTTEQNEKWVNPFYYIFGTSDAQNFYSFTSSPLPFESSSFNAVFSDMVPNPILGGNFGLYSDQPYPVSPLANTSITTDEGSKPDVRESSCQMGLLIPLTAISSMHIWCKYFFRYIPEFSLIATQWEYARQLENRFVKDVRKFKETLNELELQLGTETSDLNAFITEIMRVRDEEKRLQRAKMMNNGRRMSAFASFSSGEEELDFKMLEGKLKVPSNDLPDKARTLPAKLDESLAKFADELYSNSNGESPKLVRSRVITSSNVGGRSPVMKTRIKIQKEDANPGPSSPGNRWVGSVNLLPTSTSQNSPIMPSPPIPIHKKSSGIVEGSRDDVTDL